MYTVRSIKLFNALSPGQTHLQVLASKQPIFRMNSTADVEQLKNAFLLYL